MTYREKKPMPLPRGIHVEQLRLPRVATWARRWRALIDHLESEAPCIYLPNHDFAHSCVSPALSSRVGVVGIVHSDDRQHYDHAARLGKTWNAGVAVSEAIALRCREAGWIESGRLATIPYGVAFIDQRPARSNGAALRLLYTGRLEREQKRSADLVELAAELSQRRVNFRMTIIGDGPERKAIERSISTRGLGPVVTLLPTVSNDEVIAQCTRHDVFILPSVYEGMPLSMLEAMGQGCIPVASEIRSGVPEVVVSGTNGFTFRTGDVSGMASAVQALAESPELRDRLSEAARRTIACGDYRDDAMVAGYIALFERVWRDIESGSYVRAGGGHLAPISLSRRDRLAAALWSIRPAIRAQQRISE